MLVFLFLGTPAYGCLLLYIRDSACMGPGSSFFNTVVLSFISFSHQRIAYNEYWDGFLLNIELFTATNMQIEKVLTISWYAIKMEWKIPPFTKQWRQIIFPACSPSLDALEVLGTIL